MAHSEPIHKTIVKRIMGDEGFRWERDYVNWLRELQRSVEVNPECPYSGLLDSRFMCLQQESFVRALDEQRVALQGTDDDEAYVYPGLTLAWESSPLTLDIEPSLAKRLVPFDSSLLDTPLDELGKLFPSCLSIDIRDLCFSMHGVNVDVMYAYPSYDIERNHAMLLILGVSHDNGLMFPLQSKLVLKGSTFKDAIDASDAEQRYLAGMWWGENRAEGLVEAFSPLDDDLEFMRLAAHLLAVLCSDVALLNRSQRKASEHIWASAAPKPQVKKHDVVAETPAAEEPASEADSQIVEPAGEPSTPAAEEKIAELETTVESLRSRLASLTYSLELAHATAAKLQRQSADLKTRAELVETMDLPTTPIAALSLAADAFEDRIIFLDDAVQSCKEYKGSVPEVWAVLRAIACQLHPLLFPEGKGDISSQFREATGYELALRDTKATNSNTALKRLRRFEYKGQTRDATPHVKGKGTKRGQTLRVHFFADHEAQKIVIAHCGEHLETTSSSNKY